MKHPDLGFYDEQADLASKEFYTAASAAYGAARVLPPAAYRSKAFSELEDEKVWTRSWVAVGLEQQIPNPGDLLPFTVGYHGIHVQRDEDWNLTGRFNKAQHGGCRAVPLQCQTGRRTKCSFTSCGFSRDRNVIRATELGENTGAMQQYLGIVPEKLLAVRVETVGSVIFVNLDPNAPPLHDELEAAYPDFARDLEAFPRVVSGQWAESAANWKLMGRAFVDTCVPMQAIPPSSTGHGPPLYSAQLNREPDVSAAEMDAGRYGFDFAHVADLPAMPGCENADAKIHWLFPNLLMAVFPTHAVTVILQPLSMGECLQRVCVLAAVPSTAGSAESVTRLHAEWMASLSQVSTAAETVQTTLATLGASPGALVADDELPVETGAGGYSFQQYLIRKLLSEHEHYWNAPLYRAGAAG